MIRIGTSGWSYAQGEGRWTGIFYPPGERDPLGFYCRFFDTVEVNSSFYRPPVAPVTRTWARKTPPHFRFTMKLYQKFTHPRMYQEATGEQATVSEADYEQFRAGMAPLAEAGKLGALLAQFPPSFKADPESLDHLAELLRRFAELPVAVELRHRSWSESAEARRLLEEHGAAWTVIDEPKFRSSIGEVPITSRLGYLRFHGRNAAEWWSGDRETRYNYLYSPEEQAELAAEVRAVAERTTDTYAFYNNHYRAKAVVNALQLKLALGQPIASEVPAPLLEAYPELRAALDEARRTREA